MIFEYSKSCAQKMMDTTKSLCSVAHCMLMIKILES